jgi:transcriptional regulator with XRE-family HTH domain
VINHREAGLFLRSRRDRLRPDEFGIPAAAARRVSGLRRDEIARLAGISVEYYTRLEQGRAGTPSDSVLSTLSGALRLADAEFGYLRGLYDRSSPAKPRTAKPERIRPSTRRLLDALGTPALIFDRYTDVLAWNRGAAALFTDFGARPADQRNLARLVLLDDGFAALMADWEQVAREAVGVLRLSAGRHPDDPRLAALVGELTLKSPHFHRWWNTRDVRQKAYGTKRLNHPLAGPLTIAYETLQLPGQPGLSLVTYFAAEPVDRSTARRTGERGAVGPRGAAGVFEEERGERTGVGVADGGADAGDRLVGGLQEVAGAAYPGGLQIGERGLAGFGGEAAQQRTGADVERVGECREVIAGGEILVEPAHHPVGERVSGLWQQSRVDVRRL